MLCTVRWLGATDCSTVQCSTVQYISVQYSIVQGSTVYCGRYSKKWNSLIFYSMNYINYSTVWITLIILQYDFLGWGQRNDIVTLSLPCYYTNPLLQVPALSSPAWHVLLYPNQSYSVLLLVATFPHNSVDFTHRSFHILLHYQRSSFSPGDGHEGVGVSFSQSNRIDVRVRLFHRKHRVAAVLVGGVHGD